MNSLMSREGLAETVRMVAMVVDVAFVGRVAGRRSGR